MTEKVLIDVKGIPCDPIKADAVLKNIEAVMNTYGAAMKSIFAQTTSAWTGPKPPMGTETDVKKGQVWSGPEGQRGEQAVEKWVGLDDGIPAHNKPIVPRTKPFMVFPFQGVGHSYTAGTKIRQFWSGPHAKLGPYVYRKIIPHHPGTAPREWSKEMADQMKGPFQVDVQDAIDRGII